MIGDVIRARAALTALARHGAQNVGVIASHTSKQLDFLPGVAILAERWLEQVGMLQQWQEEQMQVRRRQLAGATESGEAQSSVGWGMKKPRKRRASVVATALAGALRVASEIVAATGPFCAGSESLQVPQQALFGIVDNLAAAKILRRCLHGLAAAGAGVRRPPLPASDDSPHLDDDASFSFGYLLEDLSAGSKVYVPHPSRAGSGAGEQLASSTLANRYTPPPKEAELALLRMRNVSMQRGDKARNGYEGPAHIMSWAAADMLSALNRAFPADEAPTARDLWSTACAGFAASRSVLFVSDRQIESTLEALT